MTGNKAQGFLFARLLGLGYRDWRDAPVQSGRKMLKGLGVPAKQTGKKRVISGIEFYDVVKQVSFFGHQLKNLHLVECNLQDATFWYGCLENCIFERCNIESMSFMATKLRDCEFLDCNATEMVFGGYDLRERRSSEFTRCNFTSCDLRRTSHSMEAYSHCKFSNCKLADVEFNGAVFEDCKFVGNVHDVWFERKHSPEQKRPNLMTRCDFREADLRRTYFDNIDLDPSMFATNDDMIWIWNPNVWIQWGATLSRENNPGIDRFVSEMMDRSGRPSLTYRSLFEEDPPEEVERLVEIASASRPREDDRQ